MANAYASAGQAGGFPVGLESARRRRLEEEARERALKRDDLQMEGMEFDLSRAKVGAERADQAYARNMDELQKRNQEEGVSDFVNALNAGVDPNIAMERFNSTGELKLAQVNYDPDKGLMLVDSEGEQMEFESPNQFAAAMGLPPGEQPEPIKLGKDDRLVTPQGETIVDADKPAAGQNLMKVGDVLYDLEKGEWITPPTEDGKDKFIKVDKQLYNTETGEWLSPPGGGGGGRDVSPFNPETTLQKIEQGIVRSHGGSFDALGNYSVPGDRELVDTKVGLAGESFARLTDYLRGGDISYSEVEAAVIRATKGLEAASDLEKRAEKWRTDGWNKSQEEKQHWMSAEREAQMADARAKLMREEQKMLARAGKKRAQREEQQGDESPVGRPEWAGDPGRSVARSSSTASSMTFRPRMAATAPTERCTQSSRRRVPGRSLRNRRPLLHQRRRQRLSRRLSQNRRPLSRKPRPRLRARWQAPGKRLRPSRLMVLAHRVSRTKCSCSATSTAQNRGFGARRHVSAWVCRANSLSRSRGARVRHWIAIAPCRKAMPRFSPSWMISPC